MEGVINNLSVLIVDDEDGIRSGISRILSNFTVSFPFMDSDICFRIIEARTGEEAIDAINNEQIDIVLLDNKLPGIQGTEVLEFINKNKPEAIVMMITSYASLELAVKATSQGAFDFIPKPFTPQELKSSIENVSKHIFLRGVTRKLKHDGKEIRHQFLSVLSHELKSPLNAIEGYLRIMQERQAGTNIEDYEPMIERSLQRVKVMRNLIMDLLDLTKIRFEKKTEKFQLIQLKDIAQYAIEAINPYAIQKDIQFSLTDNENVTMYADPGDIEIIFNNLISNAVKYNKDNGSVDITLRSENENIIICIKDSGIGLTNEEIGQLFNEFFRAKNEQTQIIAGNGLGLPIVKRVVDLYHGDIKIESQPGIFSAFTVTLPK